MNPSDSPLRLVRDELFSPKVDEALARERATRGRAMPAPEPVSAVRRVLFSSLFYFPMAAILAAIGAYLILTPYIGDMTHAAGDVILVNSDPFETAHGSSLTVGRREVVMLDGSSVKLERGARGQEAFRSLDDIRVGSTIEVVGMDLGHDDKRILAVAVRPTTQGDARASEAAAEKHSIVGMFLFFPLSATLIAFGLLFGETVSTRNWVRLFDRGLLGSGLAALFSLLAFIPAGILIWIGTKVFESAIADKAEVFTAANMPVKAFLTFVACRSAAWACIGAGLGLGMNLIRSTRAQLRNSVVGGALGGAFGGAFFDPIDRFLKSSPFEGSDLSRFIGVCTVGLAIGVFVALVERLTRDAWVRVRTGPLAGKSFILYKTPTTVGSSPQSDIYLFKDAAIDGAHAVIHRVGTAYEVEDLGSRSGTLVGGREVRRRRLTSGDQIVIGGTVLEFEERAKIPLARSEVKS